MLENRKLDQERDLFWMRREGNRYGGRIYYAARRGDFKLLQNSPFEPMNLYNLRDDPGESHPLPADHGMYNQLFRALQIHMQQAGSIPWQNPSE
jgi:arylsulfatase A-like enzyme